MQQYSSWRLFSHIRKTMSAHSVMSCTLHQANIAYFIPLPIQKVFLPFCLTAEQESSFMVRTFQQHIDIVMIIIHIITFITDNFVWVFAKEKWIVWVWNTAIFCLAAINKHCDLHFSVTCHKKERAQVPSACTKLLTWRPGNAASQHWRWKLTSCTTSWYKCDLHFPRMSQYFRRLTGRYVPRLTFGLSFLLNDSDNILLRAAC